MFLQLRLQSYYFQHRMDKHNHIKKKAKEVFGFYIKYILLFVSGKSILGGISK